MVILPSVKQNYLTKICHELILPQIIFYSVTGHRMKSSMRLAHIYTLYIHIYSFKKKLTNAT